MTAMQPIHPKHHKELRQRVQRGQFSRTPEGFLIKQADVLVKGLYLHGVNGGDWQQDPNLVPDEGLAYMLDVAFGTRAQVTNWYLALYSGQVSPQAAWKASTFSSTAGEIVSASEGYSEVNRVAFTPAAPSENQITNYASKARFTFVTGTSVSVEGVALLSAQPKGNASGLLASASRFAQPRVMYAGDTLDIGYGIALAS